MFKQNTSKNHTRICKPQKPVDFGGHICNTCDIIAFHSMKPTILKGEIDWPGVYVREPNVGKIVLMRGSGLFYLLSFDTDIRTKLLKASQKLTGYMSYD